jgi:hypothetical protein
VAVSRIFDYLIKSHKGIRITTNSFSLAEARYSVIVWEIAYHNTPQRAIEEYKEGDTNDIEI